MDHEKIRCGSGEIPPGEMSAGRRHSHARATQNAGACY